LKKLPQQLLCVISIDSLATNLGPYTGPVTVGIEPALFALHANQSVPRFIYELMSEKLKRFQNLEFKCDVECR